MAATKKRVTKKPVGKSTSSRTKASKPKSSAQAVAATASKPKPPPAKTSQGRAAAAPSPTPAAKRASAAQPGPPPAASRVPNTKAQRPSAKTKPTTPKATLGSKPGVAKASPKSSQIDGVPQASGTAATLEGSPLPKFSLADHSGTLVEHGALLGEPFVLYFYPKDDTPGCTKEACDFNAGLDEFRAAGVRVIGVSPDSVSRHTNFRTKYGLQFTLLSDPDAALARALDVYKLKKNYGREYMGIERTTFLVDAEGVIRKVWRGVRVAGHVPDVMAAVRAL